MKDQSYNVYKNNSVKSFFLHGQLLDSLSIPVFVTDKNDRLVYVNKKFSDVINYHSSINNRSMKEIVTQEDWNMWNENLFRLSNIHDNESCIFDIRFDDNESVKLLKLEAKVLQRDDNNNPSYYFFTTQNVKDLKEAVNEKTVHLKYSNPGKTSAEKKLERTVQDLDRSNKDLEEFAYIASHDLQEPLRKITSFTTRLDYKFGEKLGDDGKFLIKKITGAADGMKQLIDNLLQISRTVQHAQPFTIVHLNEIISQVKLNLEINSDDNSVKIIQHNLPVIEGLPLLLALLFNNLLSNAIKFSSKNQTPVIHINSKKLSQEEKTNLQLPLQTPYYKISVQDNGIGFSCEAGRQIFKLFYRVHGKTEYPGTGIGLALCKKIAEKHNGLIWAESTPGEGATFHIVLPQKQGYQS